MTIAEAENFYSTDRKEYIIEKNRIFMSWLYDKLKKGYNPYLTLEELQELINKIKTWYEMKLPDRSLDLEEGIVDTRVNEINDFNQDLDFDQLRYRLSHRELELIDCNYRSYCGHSTPNWGGYNTDVTDGFGWIDYIGFKIIEHYPDHNDPIKLISATSKGGLVSTSSLSDIETLKPLLPESAYITVEELNEIIKNTPTVTSTDLEKIIFNHETDVDLRRKLINLVNLSLIYSDSTTPEHGEKRAQLFSEEISTRYNIDINYPSIKELQIHGPIHTSKLDVIKTSNIKRKIKRQERKTN